MIDQEPSKSDTKSETNTLFPSLNLSYGDLNNTAWALREHARKMERERDAARAVEDMRNEELAVIKERHGIALIAKDKAEAKRNEAMADKAELVRQHNQLMDVLRETQEQLAAANKRYDEEKAIVDRIWAIFGSPTYEELQGRSIYDLVEGANKRAEDAEKILAKVLEKTGPITFYNPRA